MAKGLDLGTPAMALLATLAVAGFTHREELGRLLNQALGNQGSSPASGSSGNSFGTGFGEKSGGLGNILGNLGGLFGLSSAGGILSDGLGGLLDRFRANGHGDDANSWVKDGPNRTIDSTALEEALGPDVVAQLQAQTGLSRDELLRRLSTNLPSAVDSLTPEGRVPTPAEADQLLPAT